MTGITHNQDIGFGLGCWWRHLLKQPCHPFGSERPKLIEDRESGGLPVGGVKIGFHGKKKSMLMQLKTCRICGAVLVAGSVLLACSHHSPEMQGKPTRVAPTPYGYSSHEHPEMEPYGRMPYEPRNVVVNTPSAALYQVGMEHPFQTLPGSATCFLLS
jgi:hypothetical protein